ncbi:MAG: hypothetical protein D3910_26210 [Candidatus Electrothrix sp. ATG2]|nr:hypothetical protein [Candidatus Electrothrix sp. ATG2]
MRRFKVTVTKNGGEFTGDVTVKNNTLTVVSANLGSRVSPVSCHNKFLAEILLEQLIDENKKRINNRHQARFQHSIM